MKGDSLDGRSSKSQNPNSKQTSNFQIQNRPRRAGRPFIGWDLEFLWSLDLGISHRLFFQGIDSFGQIKIKLRQATFAVR